MSPVVHALPSPHAVPSGAAGFVHWPVLAEQTPAAWHSSLAVHVTGFDPVHVPLWQVSVCVQALPSLHDVPFGAAGFEQVPVLALHVPTAWHRSLAVHVTGLLPVHVPLWHVSVCVHAFPSLQLVPFAATGFEQTPVDVLHVPTAWHWSLAVQVTGFAPTQAPA